MRYLSVCSGIEAATVAWHSLGWSPAAFSEIEKFPSAVLAHHYPDVPNLGDMTKFKEWNLGTIDLLVGGTPCQSFSVAGLRKGLDDPRGNLMLTYLAIAERFKPKWLVWENVPGVLSSNNGKDFGSLLGGLAELGYGFAYRVLDAQYFGVPQRRRRVFVVGCLGDWRAAASVLFERHSLQGNPTPQREAGESVAGTISKCSFDGGAGGRPEGAVAGHFQIAPALRAQSQSSHRADSEAFVAVSESVAGTLQANGKAAGSATQQDAESGLLIPISYGIQANIIGRQDHNGGNGIGISEGIAPILTKADQHGVCVVPTLTSNGDAHTGFRDEHGLIAQSSQVRRLTPVECARLQGFPDSYLDIQYRNKPAVDGPKYKALGNSMAVPVMEWIGKRIQLVEDISQRIEA